MTPNQPVIKMDKEDIKAMDPNEIPTLQDILKQHFKTKHMLENLMTDSLGLLEDQYKDLINLEKRETKKALECWFSCDEDIWKELKNKYFEIL